MICDYIVPIHAKYLLDGCITNSSLCCFYLSTPPFPPPPLSFIISLYIIIIILRRIIGLVQWQPPTLQRSARGVATNRYSSQSRSYGVYGEEKVTQRGTPGQHQLMMTLDR